MAEKRWNEMSASEKCDNLKLNQERLYGIASSIATEIQQTRNHLNPTITKIETAIEQLDARMRALDGK
jgi:hypothetical protein